ncbi:MAG TPA: TatD family hydrolase [Bacillota bacterium]|nr:TatD family hydrolase [Bacillota bacterium]HOJ84207.1 TatD family hydrolase [Bacillota bacterium]HOL14633.1 TatD family hydrolase [Bacillota bacterium]HPZ10737.1 TatD family hydrolase [Bacillota bacterium]HQE08903.1 TatD family hydrolase [Bacillota bacterium]
MAPLIDSHAHLNFPQYKADLEQVLARAREAGVGMIINVGADESSSEAAVKLSESYPQLWASVGVHPHAAAGVSPRYRSKLADLAANRRVLAMGEMGLDFYRDLSPRPTQEKVFREQLELAAELNRPVIIHSRAAHARTLQVLREIRPPRAGIAHCFSGSSKELDAFLELGFYISIAGPVTYPRSHELRALLKEIPAGRLLLETDAPYLSPLPHRGKRNEPAFIRATYERVALALDMELDSLARQVQANITRLFWPEQP